MDYNLKTSELIEKINKNESFEEVSENLEKLVAVDPKIAVKKSIEILDENGFNFELEVQETALIVLSKCAPKICIEKAKQIIENQYGDCLLEELALELLFYLDEKEDN